MGEQITFKNGEIQRLIAEVEREKARAPSFTLKASIAKLQSQLVAKDKRSDQLKAAIRALEERLVEAMQANADNIMSESQLKSAELATQQAQDLVAQVESLKRENARLRSTDPRSRDKAFEEERRALEADVARAKEATSRAVTELTEERRTVRDLQARLRAASRPASGDGRSPASGGRADELERQVKVLTDANSNLLRRVQDRDRAAGGAPEGPSAPAPAPHTEPAATSSPSAAVERWEEGVKLRKKVEALRAKLAGKERELEANEVRLKKALETVEEMKVERARVEARLRQGGSVRTGSAAALKAALDDSERLGAENERLRKQLEVERPSELLAAQTEAAGLRAERDAQRARERRSEAAAAAGVVGGDALRAVENELAAAITARRRLEAEVVDRSAAVLEARLECETAAARADRLQSRLDAVLEGEPRPGTARAAVAATGAQSKKLSELEDVIGGLRHVVSKLQGENTALRASGTSNKKYMEAVNAAREAKKRGSELEAEVTRLRALDAQNKDLTRRLAAAEEAAAALRRRGGAAGAAPGGAAASGGEAAEVGALREQVRAAVERAEMAEAQAAAAASAAARGDSSELRRQLAAAQETVARHAAEAAYLADENRDLKTELQSMDPAFFEELEDQKLKMAQQDKILAKYEDMLKQAYAKERRVFTPFQR